MLDDPGLDPREIADAVADGYGIAVAGIRFLSSHDLEAASYELDAADGHYFLKVRFGPSHEASLEVPAALREAGIRNVLPPVRTRASALSAPMGEHSLVLHPFVRGRSAVEAGMSADQWRAFGTTLRAVHDSGLEARFAGLLPYESFALPSAAAVRDAMELAKAPPVTTPAAERLRAFLEEHRVRIGAMLERADDLGARLRDRSFRRVLCHADIHAANILVTDEGGILLVDWDGPMLAPPERDLLFVIGSRIARRVEPREEAWFFDGYGEVAIDAEALVYFRYERIIEDIGIDATAVLADPDLPEASRGSVGALLESFFGPGGIIEAAEAPKWRG